MSMITASTWAPRGAAATFPRKYDVDDAELSRISKLAKLQLEEAKDDLQEVANGSLNTSKTDDSHEEASGTEVQLRKSQG